MSCKSSSVRGLPWRGWRLALLAMSRRTKTSTHWLRSGSRNTQAGSPSISLGSTDAGPELLPRLFRRLLVAGEPEGRVGDRLAEIGRQRDLPQSRAVDQGRLPPHLRSRPHQPSAEPADVWQPPGTEDCLTTEAALRRLD